MRKHVSILALISLAAGAYVGCSKDYITNNITEVPGETGIIGRVTPGEPGIIVSAWQAAKIKEVTADDSGYFAILGLATGLYEVRAVTLSGQSSVLPNLKVSDGETSAVILRLDSPALPPMITSVAPADGSKGVRPMNTRIYVGAREPLDVTSLASSVVLTPQVAGRWSSGAMVIYPDIPLSPEEGIIRLSSSATYYFEPDSQFVPATDYTVRILPSLRLADGSEWGDSLKFSFTTDSLRLTCFSVGSGTCDDTIIPLRWFQVQLRFNSAVHLDSVNAAASFTPDLEGVWYYAESYSGQRTDVILFFFTGPASLRAEWPFTFALSGSVGLAGPVGLGTDFEVALVTEPVRVVRILPPKGADAPVSTWVEVEFNTAMDHPSAEAAVTLRAFNGSTIAGSKVWLDEYRLTFRPDAPLMLGQAYEVNVDNTAVSVLGDTLREPAYSFFRAAY